MSRLWCFKFAMKRSKGRHRNRRSHCSMWPGPKHFTPIYINILFCCPSMDCNLNMYKIYNLNFVSSLVESATKRVQNVIETGSSQQSNYRFICDREYAFYFLLSSMTDMWWVGSIFLVWNVKRSAVRSALSEAHSRKRRWQQQSFGWPIYLHKTYSSLTTCCVNEGLFVSSTPLHLNDPLINLQAIFIQIIPAFTTLQLLLDNVTSFNKAT